MIGFLIRTAATRRLRRPWLERQRLKEAAGAKAKTATSVLSQTTSDACAAPIRMIGFLIRSAATTPTLTRAPAAFIAIRCSPTHHSTVLVALHAQTVDLTVASVQVTASRRRSRRRRLK